MRVCCLPPPACRGRRLVALLQTGWHPGSREVARLYDLVWGRIKDRRSSKSVDPIGRIRALASSGVRFIRGLMLLEVGPRSRCCRSPLLANGLQHAERENGTGANRECVFGERGHLENRLCASGPRERVGIGQTRLAPVSASPPHQFVLGWRGGDAGTCQVVLGWWGGSCQAQTAVGPNTQPCPRAAHPHAPICIAAEGRPR